VNLPEGLPSSGTPGLAALAAKSAVLRRAAPLAGWAGGGKRTLTAKGVLRKQDVPAAAAVIGVKAPQAVRSAADLPELHVAWCAAIGMGLLTVEGGRASGGPELKNWPPDDGTRLLEAWLKGFFAVSAVLGGDRDLGRGFLVLVLALLKVLQDEDAPAGRGLLREVLDAADEICDSRDLDVDVYGTLSGLSSPGMPRIEGLTALLADFGITTKARPVTSKAPAVTPLGEWAASRLAEVFPVPLDAGLTAEELIEGAANVSAGERETLADSWLDARDPADAVREILSAAEDMPSRLRVVALELAEMTGEDGWPAWREIAGDDARWPHAARHARVFLSSMGQGPEPARADWQWVGTEAAAAALYEAGPDEALCCIWDTIDGDDDIAKRLAGMRASGHPEAEHVASSVEAFAASGVPLTIRRGIQLKVALRYAKPPVWRSVQLRLTATLGDLHAAIQVLFGWDGDHLHVFHAGGVRYSDPLYELEETEDEEDAPLRDAFPPDGPKITYVYDFGADWVHEITRQKVITLEPGQDYPVCVAFGGDSPVEYPSEGEPEEPEPFDQAAVNTALAGILRS
jgi:pRiA4b ORF-3-like protein